MTAPAETPAYSPFLDDVQAFEQAVLAQEPVAAVHYDDEYFAADWREGGNRYDLETRRRVEDRNPALIARKARLANTTRAMRTPAITR